MVGQLENTQLTGGLAGFGAACYAQFAVYPAQVGFDCVGGHYQFLGNFLLGESSDEEPAHALLLEAQRLAHGVWGGRGNVAVGAPCGTLAQQSGEKNVRLWSHF